MKIIDGNNYLEEIKELITEYTTSLGRDLDFQHLSEEMDNLGLKYTSPNGEILAAISDEGQVAGCVAYRRHQDKCCEMKRLYVKPEYRKMKLGQKLVEEIIKRARVAGYEEMLLDTIRPLESAIGLYKRYGFEEIPAYYDNPMEDVVYMKLLL